MLSVSLAYCAAKDGSKFTQSRTARARLALIIKARAGAALNPLRIVLHLSFPSCTLIHDSLSSTAQPEPAASSTMSGSADFFKHVENRRTYYGLKAESPISDDKIVE